MLSGDGLEGLRSWAVEFDVALLIAGLIGAGIFSIALALALAANLGVFVVGCSVVGRFVVARFGVGRGLAISIGLGFLRGI